MTKAQRKVNKEKTNMWMIFLKNLMDIGLRMLKNPTVIVGLIGAILSGFLFFKGVVKDHTIESLKGKVTVAENNLKTSQGNEQSCVNANEQIVKGQEVLKLSVKSLQQLVRDEQANTLKWKAICQGKPVDVGQVPSKPQQDKGVIVDDKGNKEYIKYLNSLYGVK